MQFYPPSPVAYGQSCINMNTHFKCRNNCIYCFGKNWKDRHLTFDPEEMVKMLPEKINIPIGINNSASDPFDPNTWPSTLELIELLVGRADTIMLITKEFISESQIKLLESFQDKGLQIIMFISYSGLPAGYEHLVDDRRMETLGSLSKSTLPTVLYARPLVGRINDFNLIRAAAELADYVVWSSVRVDNNTAHKLLPPPTGENLHKSHKRISDDDLAYIENELSTINRMVFRKTSCVISYIQKIPDYNAHWVSPELYGCNHCKKEQKDRCMSQSRHTPEFSPYVQQILDKYKLPAYIKSIPGSWVLESNMASFSCLRAGILRKITGFQVLFPNPYDNGNLITAENLAYQHYELRGEKEGNIPL